MKGKWMLIALILLCLTVSIMSSVRLKTLKNSNQGLVEENARLTLAVETMTKSLEDTQHRIDALETSFAAYQGLSDDLRQQLMEKGHKDPEAFILQALAEHEDLIQSQPVLGGTFMITSVIIIKDGLAFIEFEDGHIQGYMIVSFAYHGESDGVIVERVFEVLE